MASNWREGHTFNLIPDSEVGNAARQGSLAGPFGGLSADTVTPSNAGTTAGLFLFDLDGTILVAGRVSRRVTEALGAATRAGYVCAIASGRPLCLIGKGVLGTGIMTHAVVANGAEVWDLRSRTRLFHRPMPRGDALIALDALADLEPAWNCFMDGRAYFEWAGVSYLMRGVNGAAARERRQTGRASVAQRISGFFRRGLRFAKRLALNRDSRQVLSIRPFVSRAEGGVDKLGCTFADAERTDEAVGRLVASGRYEVARMGAAEIEVTALGVTKASGATLLMDHLGVKGEDAVAFGDGGNDLPMADVATFVAMGNADEEVRMRADEVCPSVAEDGVAVWMEARLGVRA